MNGSAAPSLDALVRATLTRVYEAARETPLDHAPRLSRRLDNVVLLKREDPQPVSGSQVLVCVRRVA